MLLLPGDIIKSFLHIWLIPEAEEIISKQTGEKKQMRILIFQTLQDGVGQHISDHKSSYKPTRCLHRLDRLAVLLLDRINITLVGHFETLISWS